MNLYLKAYLTGSVLGILSEFLISRGKHHCIVTPSPKCLLSGTILNLYGWGALILTILQILPTDRFECYSICILSCPHRDSSWMCRWTSQLYTPKKKNLVIPSRIPTRLWWIRKCCSKYLLCIFDSYIYVCNLPDNQIDLFSDLSYITMYELEDTYLVT